MPQKFPPNLLRLENEIEYAEKIENDEYKIRIVNPHFPRVKEFAYFVSEHILSK